MPERNERTSVEIGGLLTAPVSDSCIKKRPFIELGNSDYAPTLNYNIEVSTCLPATAMIPVKIPAAYIKDEYFAVPANNVWDIVKDLTHAEILAEVMAILSGMPGEYGIFINTHLLQGIICMKTIRIMP